MPTCVTFRLAAALLVCTALGFAAPGPDVAASLGARVRYDSNVFLQNPDAPVTTPAPDAVPGRVAAILSEAKAAVGLRWRGNADRSANFEAGYAAEVFHFAGYASEDHVDHAFTAAFTRAQGNWSGEMKARYAYTDGSREGPTFNCLGGLPAIGGEPIRARREQATLRASGQLTRTFEQGFARGVFTWFNQDFRTRHRANTGYTNYVDRSDATVGADVGRRILPGTSLVAALRVGEQRQANLLGVPLNYTNRYLRWLGGIEGAPAPAWKLAFLAGPDVRRFGISVRPTTARDEHTIYAEANAAWTPTRRDELRLSGKRHLWLSSLGRNIYGLAVVDLAWRHTLGPGTVISASLNFQDGDFRRFNPASPRHDRIYGGTLGVSRTLHHGLRLELELLPERSDSLIANTPAREYQRWIGSIGLSRAW